MPQTAPKSAELLRALRALTDEELMRRLQGLTARERRATALIVAHLAELDTRDTYLRAGYSSLFSYCCEVLALSEHEALNRIDAARTARRFPVILELLASAEINLTTVRLLGPHLTADNHVAVLAAARGKRKAGIEEIVARLSPRLDVPASARRLPEPRAVTGPTGRSSPERNAASGPADSAAVLPSELGNVAVATPVRARGAGCGPETMSAVVPRTRRAAEVTPLSPDRYRYQLTIGGATLEKLRLAKDMLRHALPSGDDEAVLDRALTALLAELARKKFGAEPMKGSASKEGSIPAKTPKEDSIPAQAGKEGSIPEKAASKKAASPGEHREGSRGEVEDSRHTGEVGDSRHIPVDVKRAVWVRDLGRCAFVGTDGHRCGERAFVEFHHVRPYAGGGRPTVGNIQLRCWRHNGYEARVFFAREPFDEGEGAPGGGLRGRSGTSSRGREDGCPTGRVEPRSGTARGSRDPFATQAASASLTPAASS